MATDMTLPDDLDRLVDRLVRDARGRRPVMVLDGGSGAGKTRLATRLVGALGERGMHGVQLVSMDSFYPGWDGLQAASTMLPEVLRVHDPGYWRWDWQAGRRTDRVGLDGDAPILVEGCGALTAFSAGVGTTAMWFVMDAASCMPPTGTAGPPRSVNTGAGTVPASWPTSSCMTPGRWTPGPSEAGPTPG